VAGFRHVEVEIYIQALQLLNFRWQLCLLLFNAMHAGLRYYLLAYFHSFNVQSAPRAGGSNIRKPKSQAGEGFRGRHAHASYNFLHPANACSSASLCFSPGADVANMGPSRWSDKRITMTNYSSS